MIVQLTQLRGQENLKYAKLNKIKLLNAYKIIHEAFLALNKYQ